jgi:hypothetical protein
MAKYLDQPNECGGTTDHSEEIAELRTWADNALREMDSEEFNKRTAYISIHLAADLLEAHDQNGISLDDWPYARQFVETFLQRPILPNCI